MKKIIQSIILATLVVGSCQSYAKERKAVGEFIPISWKEPSKIDPSLYIVEVKMDNGTKCYFISNQLRQYLLESINQIRGIGCK